MSVKFCTRSNMFNYFVTLFQRTLKIDNGYRVIIHNNNDGFNY